MESRFHRPKTLRLRSRLFPEYSFFAPVDRPPAKCVSQHFWWRSLTSAQPSHFSLNNIFSSTNATSWQHRRRPQLLGFGTGHKFTRGKPSLNSFSYSTPSLTLPLVSFSATPSSTQGFIEPKFDHLNQIKLHKHGRFYFGTSKPRSISSDVQLSAFWDIKQQVRFNC